jgi:hypothetical protein
MKWIATVANFFFPGLGNIVSGHKRLLGIGWLLGFIALTYVEFSIQGPLPTVYWVMFSAVLLINSMFAISLFQSLSARERAVELQSS